MKRKKAHFRPIKRFFRKYINGTKGAISLFLAFLMTPILSLALLLVEAERYQSAVELMTELVDSAGLSTLANYDSYMEERFGLLSVSQDSDIGTDFMNYLNLNVDSLSSSATIASSSSATGTYSLSNKAVLKQQLLEYSEIMVAVEAGTELTDLSGILKDLKKKLGLSELQDSLDLVQETVDATEQFVDFSDAIVNATKDYNKYKKAAEDFQNEYNDFVSCVSSLSSALKDAQEEADENPDENIDIYSDSKVKRCISSLNSARRDYKSAADELASKISDFKGSVDSLFSTLSTLGSDLNSISNSNVGSTSSLGSAAATSTEWVNDVYTDIYSKIAKYALTGSNGDQYMDAIYALNSLSATLNSEITSTTIKGWASGNSYTLSIPSRYKIPSDYTQLASNLTGFTSALEDANAILEEDAMSDDEESSITEYIDALTDILGISVLYDSDLDAYVSASYMFTNVSMSTSQKSFVDSISDLVSAFSELKDGLGGNVVELAKGIYHFVKGVCEFIKALITWIGQVFGRIATMVANVVSGDLNDVYNDLLLYGYAAYNLPNRTNYSSGKTLTGYKYSKIFSAAGGTSSGGFFASLEQLSTLSGTSGVSNSTFKGAEVEYLLIGSNSELMNQSVAFLDIYLLRLVLDVVPILTNSQFSTIAAAAGPASIAVYIAGILIEPFIDSVMLVNGVEEYLFKDDIYLSYSGIVDLKNDLVDATNLGKSAKSALQQNIKNHNGKPTISGTINLSYTEHMLLLMMLMLDNDTYLKRMQNIIQMETANNYRSSYDFKLEDAYTYVLTDVTYTLNPLFNLKGLTDNGLFDVSVQRYIGY